MANGIRKTTYEALKNLEPILEKSWKYSKVELAPPYSLEWLNGPGGKQLEKKFRSTYKSLMASVEPPQEVKEPIKAADLEKKATKAAPKKPKKKPKQAPEKKKK